MSPCLPMPQEFLRYVVGWHFRSKPCAVLSPFHRVSRGTLTSLQFCLLRCFVTTLLRVSLLYKNILRRLTRKFSSDDLVMRFLCKGGNSSREHCVVSSFSIALTVALRDLYLTSQARYISCSLHVAHQPLRCESVFMWFSVFCNLCFPIQRLCEWFLDTNVSVVCVRYSTAFSPHARTRSYMMSSWCFQNAFLSQQGDTS